MAYGQPAMLLQITNRLLVPTKPARSEIWGSGVPRLLNSQRDFD